MGLLRKLSLIGRRKAGKPTLVVIRDTALKLLPFNDLNELPIDSKESLSEVWRVSAGEELGITFFSTVNTMHAGDSFQSPMFRKSSFPSDFNGYIQISLDLSTGKEWAYRFKDCFVLASNVQIKIPAGLPLRLQGSEKILLKARPVAETELSATEKIILQKTIEMEAISFFKESDHYKIVLKKPVDNYRQWYVSDKNFQITANLDSWRMDFDTSADLSNNYEVYISSKKNKIVDSQEVVLIKGDIRVGIKGDVKDEGNLPRSLGVNLPLVRYPNLDCPDKAIINQRFSLTVELLLEKPDDQPDLIPMNVQDTGTEELPEVEAVLSASGFDIEGSNTQILEVDRDDDSSVRFALIPRKVGQHKVKVDFWQQGRRIGTARRNILVSEVPTSASVEQPDEPLLLEIRTEITVPPQDLDLLVDVLEDGQTLSFRLRSDKADYNLKRVGQITLQGSPLDKMQGLYEEMTNMAKKVPTTPEDRELAERRLTAIGNQLWDELVSDSLKQEYWRFKSRVKSLLITSEEPWIPWEMIKPYRYNDDGDVEQEPFWCQQFALSRWLAEGSTADEMIMGKARSIAPTPTNLPSVQAELAFIEQLPTLRPGITPLSTFGTRLQVLDCFTNEEFSLLHFACHGTFDSTSPNNSAIKLADGELRPADIRVKFTGRRPRPLIFINACHGARSEYSFTGLGGWATMLVKANVGAFIGAMWEVSDKLALQFAKTFYTQLLQENQSIAESFRVAREEIRKAAPYNSTWLAYTLYADPEGRVKVSKH